MRMTAAQAKQTASKLIQESQELEKVGQLDLAKVSRKKADKLLRLIDKGKYK